jgi:hypothetical protein
MELGGSCFQIGAKPSDQILALALHHVIGFSKGGVFGTRNGAAYNGAHSQRLTAGDLLFQRWTLNNHRAEKHDIRPGDVGVAEPLDIKIHEPSLPTRRQQRGN